MASIISAGTTSGTALNMAGDTSGVLQLATNGSTTAITIDTSQNTTFAGKVTSAGALTLASNGTTTALTIDTSQKVGIGTTSPAAKLDVRYTSFTPASSIGSLLVEESTAWSQGIQFYINSAGLYATSRPSGALGAANSNNMFLTGGSTITNDVDAANGLTAYASAASMYRCGAGSHVWYGNTGLTAGSTFTQTERMRIDSSGSLILAGSTAQKATGTTWSNPSDQRLKDNIRDYTKGTNELMQVRVREWEYNGKGGTTEGLKGLGVVADEVITVLPNTVETYDAKLNADDEETTEIKKFDATEITWLLVKTVQEQQTIINDLKARITALEGAA